MHTYPLIFHPLLKSRVWGGRTLERFGKTLPPGELIGESWEIADLPDSIADGRSIIANGPLQGLSLRHIVNAHREELMGDSALTAGGGFPLLVKFLDAQQNLSVQVHPDEPYVSRHPRTHLKSEAWVILDAKPGAVIYKGVRKDITAQQFADHIRRGGRAVVDDLMAVPATVGDCHYLPSGLCHALGGGVLVAEIQTPSDTTFRLYDWDRPATPERSLHIEQALECMRLDDVSCANRTSHHIRSEASQPSAVAAITVRSLCTTEFFAIERIDAVSQTTFPVVTSGRPEVWITIQGAGRMQTRRGMNVDLSAGTTVLVPALCQDATVSMNAGAGLLRVTLPSPLKGLIA